MSMVRVYRDRLRNRKVSFIADQRGAVAFEMPFIFLFLMMSLFLPLADVAVAGFRYISAWQALRAFGQSIQYNLPDDVANVSSNWTSSTQAKAAAAGLQNFSIRYLCGENLVACSAANTNSPMYYSYSTTVTLAPLVLKSLCTSDTGDGCTHTLHYSERFK